MNNSPLTVVFPAIPPIPETYVLTMHLRRKNLRLQQAMVGDRGSVRWVYVPDVGPNEPDHLEASPAG